MACGDSSFGSIGTRNIGVMRVYYSHAHSVFTSIRLHCTFRCFDCAYRSVLVSRIATLYGIFAPQYYMCRFSVTGTGYLRRPAACVSPTTVTAPTTATTPVVGCTSPGTATTGDIHLHPAADSTHNL